MYTEACQIVVKADSSINTVEDLQDKRVSVGEEESGTEQNAKQILAAYGLNDSLVDEVNLDYSNAAEELREGKIDAFFCTAGAQTTVIGELAKKCDIRLLSIDEKSAEKLKGTYKFYTDCTIPKETYNGQTEDVKTVGVNAVLLASDKLSADTVKDITKITGYVRGGCSPLGMKKQFPTILDKSMEQFDKIYISGGRIGTSMALSPADLAAVTGAAYADITAK